jgi:hypothetical protein
MMKKFIFQSLIFLSILFALDRSFILFRTNETNIFDHIAKEKMTIISSEINKAKKPDILIVGSSHAQFGISPEILAKELNRSVLNVAYGGGANIGVQLTLIRKLIYEKKIIPGLIVFGMDVFTLNAEPVYSDAYQPYLFNESASIQGFFRSKIFYSYFKLYARFIPSYISQMKAGNYSLPYLDKKNSYDLSMFDKYEKYEISNGGWVKGYGLLNKKYVRYSEVIFNPDTKAEADLKKYVDLCKSNNITINFIQIPENNVCFKWNKKYDDFNAWMNQFVKKNNSQYWDFDNLSNFPSTNDSLFFDSDHLNKEGAELFSVKLAEKIKAQ